MSYQDNTPVTKRSIKKQIVEAQAIAKDAVKADNFHCYEEAIILYETAINEIKRILKTVENEKIMNNETVISDSDFILLQNIHSAYYDRLDFLKVNTDTNYTNNLKNIEVANDKTHNINTRNQDLQKEYAIANKNIEIQRMKKMQEYQKNLELFETMDFFNMQNKSSNDDFMKKTQNSNEMSELLFEDSHYTDVKPPNYSKVAYNPLLKNKLGFFIDEESSLMANPNNDIFKNQEYSNPDFNNNSNNNNSNSNSNNNNNNNINIMDTIPSNNIFLQNINNNDLNDSLSTIPRITTLNRKMSSTNNSIANNNSNNINSKMMQVNNSSSPISPEKAFHNFNEKNSNIIDNTSAQKPKSLQVQIPKREPSLSRKNKNNNTYALPFSSKLISQPTPTTPTTAYISYNINDQMSVNKDNISFSNSLPYSIEYVLLEQPHNAQKPEKIPNKLILRPFWIMRLLYRSMFEGGYLTPRLYVPKQLWYQKGVKYVAIETKYQACVNLVQHLEKIYNANIDNPSEFYNILSILENETDAIQNMLSKKLKFIDEMLEIEPVINMDKQVNMALVWKYGFESLRQDLPKDEDLIRRNTTRSKIDDMVDPLHSVTSHHSHHRIGGIGDDYMNSRNGNDYMMSNIGTKSNNIFPDDDIIKSTTKSINEITNPNRIPDSIYEDEILKKTSAYSISTISINSNMTSSSKLAHSKSRLSRSMDKFNKKGEKKVNDISGYVDTLMSLFNDAQIIVKWINETEEKLRSNPSEVQYENIYNQLYRISNFFGRVICTFVLKDFEMLLDRYLYKIKQNI